MEENYLRRVKDPAHGVIDKLGLGECLMSTLVCDDPETHPKKTDPKAIQRPC